MSAILEILRELEVSLHQSSNRKSVEVLDELLDAGFREIGRSGQIYDRKDVIASLLNEKDTRSVIASDFDCKLLCDDVALLTYRSESGNPAATTLRSSIWKKGPAGWQMTFHQGTPHRHDGEIRS